MGALRLRMAFGLLLLSTARCAPPALAAPDACRRPAPDADAIAAFLRAGCYKSFAHDRAKVRPTGESPGARSPHDKVRVYYSPEVVDWLRGGRPQPGIPDGALIYKEMYAWEGERLTGGAFMLKAQGRSFDGWFWGGFNQKRGTAWGEWSAGGCLNCHASADGPELTFSSLRHLEGGDREPADGAASPVDPDAAGPPHVPHKTVHTSPPPRLLRRAQLAGESDEAAGREEAADTRSGAELRAAFVARYPAAYPPTRLRSFFLPDESLGDGFVPGPGGPEHFHTAHGCAACHAADPPDLMSAPAPSGQHYDLSPHGEWSASLMGLSGRDPVFHAQLEAEKALRPALAGYLDDTCYRCHGVMGRRQHEIDHPGEAFTHKMVLAPPEDPAGKYGALARDGVSCLACHHVAAAGLGGEASFTGAFQVPPPGVVYGPYKDRVRDKPMRQALGYRVQAGAHLGGSALCGSCHTVRLPHLPRGAAGVPPGTPTGHEQTTYLEWRASAYQDETGTGPLSQSCQGCHMPRRGPDGKPLRFKVAGIEEFLPQIDNSLPAADITLPRRATYGRHTLVGLNYFVLQMFDQFPRVLGIDRDGVDGAVPPLRLALQETLRQAEERTATVTLPEPPRLSGDTLRVLVRVTNLAGHKLPSGVGFRRAFLTLRVLGAGGRVLFASGDTDELGAILGGDGRPLPAELSSDPRLVQPHHQVITSADQAQIYEERHTDDSGALTTSFLGLYRRVKDNRLLPRGFARGAPDFLRPVGTGGDPAYAAGDGTDEVRYEVRLPKAAGEVVAVEAALYYQSLPPYYLRDRFQTEGRETRRLYYLASRLRTKGTSPIAGWKLRLAGCRAPVTR